MEFESLPLHDASLNKIQYDWEIHQLNINGILCSKSHSKFKLIFESVSFVGIPHKYEWGESKSINELTTNGKGVFNINMQSGDIISVKAKKYSYESENT